jgi:hypothetical protein
MANLQLLIPEFLRLDQAATILKASLWDVRNMVINGTMESNSLEVIPTKSVATRLHELHGWEWDYVERFILEMI